MIKTGLVDNYYKLFMNQSEVSLLPVVGDHVID